jgi:hypothetical protein
MKKTFTITCPPGSIILFFATGIVYDWKAAWILLAFLFLVGTIMDNK